MENTTGCIEISEKFINFMYTKILKPAFKRNVRSTDLVGYIHINHWFENNRAKRILVTFLNKSHLFNFSRDNKNWFTTQTNSKLLRKEYIEIWEEQLDHCI